MENTITPPSGCRQIQLAVQIPPKFRGDKRYTIRKDLFEHEKFANTSRAGLIFHELLYRLTSLAGAQDSRSARLLTSIFFSGNQQELTGGKGSNSNYFEYLKLARIPWAGANGVAIRLDKPFLFDTDDKLTAGSAIAGWWAETPLGRQQIACHVGFDSNGSLREFSIGNSAGFISDIKFAGFENLTLISKIWSSHTVPNNWEERYVSDECSEVSSESDYRERNNVNGEKIISLKMITPCITTTFQNEFYHVNACVNQNVTISTDEQNARAWGNTDRMSDNRITFATGEFCDSVTWSSPKWIQIDGCTARVFRDRTLSLDGDIRTSTNKLSVTLDKLFVQKLTHKTHGKNHTMKAKPGSVVTFDVDGKIHAMTIHQTETLCTFPNTTHKRTFSAGLTLTFESQSGCVENFF